MSESKLKNFKNIIFMIAFLFPMTSQSGIFEVGVSGSYKKSNIDKDNYTIENSVSFTLSYYYGEMSAIEYSYTDGVRRNSYKSFGSSSNIITNYSTMQSLDLVFSFAQRDATFQPFIKGGLGVLTKTNYLKPEAQPEQKTGSFSGTVPSVGIGFRFKLTKSISVKIGADAWYVKNKDSEDKSFSEWDNAARLGLNWMF